LSFQRAIEEDLLERGAGHQFHRDEWGALGFAHLINRCDAWMVQVRGGLNFFEKALAGLRIGRRVCGKKFRR